ncbi:hypothetical protein R6Q59_029466 [Mikania micrantha]
MAPLNANLSWHFEASILILIIGPTCHPAIPISETVNSISDFHLHAVPSSSSSPAVFTSDSSPISSLIDFIIAVVSQFQKILD